MTGYLLLLLTVLLSMLLKKRKHQLMLMFIGITVFSALRYGIGYDYYSYLASCQPGSIHGDYYEFIPLLIVKLSQKTFPYLFFIITSIFISFFYYKGIKNGGTYYFNEALFYICFPFLFFNQLGVVRQGMAVSVIFYALTIGHDKKHQILSFCLKVALILIAAQCHQSAYIGFLILVPWHKIPAKILWIMFIGSFVLGNAVTSMSETIIHWGILGERATVKALTYLKEESVREGTFIRYIIYFVTASSLVFYDRLVKREDKNAYYIGIIVLGCSLYALFVFNSSLSKRLCMFFFSSAILIVPQLIKELRISKYLFLILCVALFSLQIYIGSFNRRPQDRLGTSVSYPYRTFIGRSR